jgi:hypothetical protein
MRLNDLDGTTIGVDNAGTGTVDARYNFWGCRGGPLATGCATYTGNVLFKPWLRHPVREWD